MDIFFLDNLNNTKEEITILKPKSFKQLLKQIKQKFKNISEYFELFILDKNNNEIQINNEDNFKNIDDILFIRELDHDIFEHSLFDINFNRLSESKQEILEQKYSCNICTIMIKNEKPFFCYKCQKIFHEKCLKDWDKQCKLQNKKLICPSCRNELSIEKWNKKLDYEDNRNYNANLMNKINEYRLTSNMSNNINIIKDKKINELKGNEIKQFNLINKYEKYIDKTIALFKNILNEINMIHYALKLEQNDKLKNLIDLNTLDFQNLDLDDITNEINIEFEKLKIHIMKNNKTNININQNKNKKNNKNISITKNKLIKQNNNSTKNIFNANNINNINYVKNANIINSINNHQNNQKKIKINVVKKEEYKDKINLKYFVKSKGINNIFGLDFIEKNKDNIELLINGKKNVLVNRYELKEGENNITIIIKKRLNKLSYMFSLCSSLIDISELKYLDVTEVTNFEYMFSQCSSLTDINSLLQWNVSNGTNFEGMFFYCSSLSDINPLKNWNVSKGNNFSNMFYGCSSLSNINPLYNWDVSNSTTFSNIFYKCSSLSDIKSLNNWNVSNVINFQNMFYGCSTLSDISSLKNWKVSSSNTFEGMFQGCVILSDIKPLQNWNISNCNNLAWMFSGCSLLSDIKDLQNWNVKNCNNFEGMFSGCSSLSDLKPITNWNVSNGNNFSYMFRGCVKLSDVKVLESWDFSNYNNFRDIFFGCSLLRDIKSLIK